MNRVAKAAALCASIIFSIPAFADESFNWDRYHARQSDCSLLYKLQIMCIESPPPGGSRPIACDQVPELQRRCSPSYGEDRR
jgi:hypothetical protein